MAPAAAAAAAAPEFDLDNVQQQILTLVKDAPNLKPIVAAKLLEIASKLEEGATVDDASERDLPAAQRIEQGFRSFKAHYYSKHPELFRKLSTGQSPKFMVIACSDSRVCPTTILGLQPGEAFVVRNIASMVPAWGETGFPSTSAALEYGVLHLKIPNILVIGHSRCGGIKALMSLDPAKRWSDYIQDWIKISSPARSHTHQISGEETDLDDRCSHCERESVNVSLSNLVTFPWIKHAVVNGTLALHGAHYSFVDGSFEYWTLDITKSKELRIE